MLPRHTYSAGRRILRTKLDLSIKEDVAREARTLGLTLSRLAEAAVAEAARRNHKRRWREENRAALETCAREVECDGVALARFRSSLTTVAQFDGF